MNAEDKNNNAKVAKKATNKSKGPKTVAGKSTTAKRHQQARVTGVANLSNPGFRRLARKGGVKRISNESFDTGRHLVDEFVNNIVHDAVLMCESAKRKTVTSGDVSFALKRNNMTLLGI